MKIKYLSVLLLSSLVLPVFAYAQDYTFTSDWSSYNVSSFTTDWWVINMTDYTCVSNECSISIWSWNSAFCRIDYQYEFDIYTCDWKTLLPWTYRVVSQTFDYFDSITFSIVPENSWAWTVDPEIPLDVVWSFKTTLQWLVSDLVIWFYNYLPLVIVIWIGVLMIFTLRWYIRHASSEIFTLNKNSKKSLSWFQNEDIVNMYSNWKKDRVSKHDINKIVENTVDHTDEYRAKIKEFYDEEYSKYSLDQWKKDFYSWNRQWMSWVDSYSDEANYQKNVHRRVADRLEEYFDKKYWDWYGMQAVKLRNDDDRSWFTHYAKYR